MLFFQHQAGRLRCRCSDTCCLCQQVCFIPAFYLLHPLMIGGHVFSKGGVGFTVTDMQGDPAIVIVNFYHPVVIMNLYLFGHIQIGYDIIPKIFPQLYLIVTLMVSVATFFRVKSSAGMLLAGNVSVVHKNTASYKRYSCRACY
ncbi:MAG: hypothetical protein JWP81_562 [Ferruginibacter sp.]|nr:hypothetical protein [Ferruginibacter sp.]